MHETPTYSSHVCICRALITEIPLSFLEPQIANPWYRSLWNDKACHRLQEAVEEGGKRGKRVREMREHGGRKAWEREWRQEDKLRDPCASISFVSRSDWCHRAVSILHGQNTRVTLSTRHQGLIIPWHWPKSASCSEVLLKVHEKVQTQGEVSASVNDFRTICVFSIIFI